MPWQWLTLRAVLSLQDPNEWGERLWTHRDVCIECPRQNGKTLIVVLRIIFGMLVRGEKIAYTAQEWETAKDVYSRVLDVIERVPSLKRRLRGTPTTAGNRGLIKLGRGEAKFGPRTAKFGRGLTEIDLLILDEAYDLTPVAEASLAGATRAAKNPQIWYVSTPPVAALHPNSQVLAGMHRLGHTRAPDLYYALYAAPADIARADPVKAYALAHPSLGVVGDERELESKRRKAKSAEQRVIFTADYLGIGDYPPEESETASPISDEQWASMEVDDVVQLVGPRAVALERTRNGKLWTLVAAQRTTSGRIFVEVGYSSAASLATAVEHTMQVVTALDPVALVIDAKSAAAVIKAELEAAGVEPTITNMTQLALASRGFLDDALDGRLAHGGQEMLSDAVRSASMRELPSGGFTWDETFDGDPVAHLKGATLARWALVEFGSNVRPMPAPPRTKARGRVTQASDFDAMTAAF